VMGNGKKNKFGALMALLNILKFEARCKNFKIFFQLFSSAFFPPISIVVFKIMLRVH